MAPGQPGRISGATLVKRPRLFARVRRVPRVSPGPRVDGRGQPIALTSGEIRQRFFGLLATARARAADRPEGDGAPAALTDVERQRRARVMALLAIARERTARAMEASGLPVQASDTSAAGAPDDQGGHTP